MRTFLLSVRLFLAKAKIVILKSALFVITVAIITLWFAVIVIRMVIWAPVFVAKWPVSRVVIVVVWILGGLSLQIVLTQPGMNDGTFLGYTLPVIGNTLFWLYCTYCFVASYSKSAIAKGPESDKVFSIF